MHSKLLKAVSCGLVIGLACASAQARVIFSDKFEQYSLEGFGTPQEGWAIVNAPIRSGNYAASSTLLPKPYPILVSPMAVDNGGKSKDSPKGKFSVGGDGRDKSATKFKGKGGDLEKGKFYTIRFSTKVVGDTSGGIITFQIHKRRAPDDPTRGKQPVLLRIRTHNWIVSVHSNSTKGKHFKLGPVDKAGWTDWVFHVKLSTGQDGVLEVTKNGQRVLNYHGPNDFDGTGPSYVRWGAYSPKDSKKAEGDGRVTVTYDSVSIREG
jgi:hypothetical protein